MPIAITLYLSPLLAFAVYSGREAWLGWSVWSCTAEGLICENTQGSQSAH